MTNEALGAWREAKRDWCARRDALAEWLASRLDVADAAYQASLEMDAEYAALVRQHLG